MRAFRYCAVVCALLVAAFDDRPTAGAPFDFDQGNAAIEVVIPAAIPAIFASVSSGGSDAPLVLRVTTLITNAWFDAIAPYHSTAVGVYSRLGRRPPSESTTNRSKNIALIYASYRVLNGLLPQHAADWREMMTSVGLDPDDGHSGTDAIGIGNAAGRAIVAARERDGMNQLGDEGGRTFNRRPYSDYLGYRPVNTANDLRDPSRWQPAIVTRGNGTFQTQQFVTPQWGFTKPYSYQNPARFRTTPPWRSNVDNFAAYKQQADEVLAASAALSDEQKAIAELFDNKIRSLGFAALFIAESRNFTLDQFVHYDFLTNMAAFDAGIAVWRAKYRYDAVRPFSAIRHIYGDRRVAAWGGPGQGTVRIRASEWRSYLNTGDHPEYPSGSACFCAAHAQASRRFLGSDDFGFSALIPKGSSSVEPGITPAQDIQVGPWGTFTEFEQVCAMSRVWGGVHFPASLSAGQETCRPVGDLAYEFLTHHVAGVAR